VAGREVSGHRASLSPSSGRGHKKKRIGGKAGDSGWQHRGARKEQRATRRKKRKNNGGGGNADKNAVGGKNAPAKSRLRAEGELAAEPLKVKASSGFAANKTDEKQFRLKKTLEAGQKRM